ncbi:MAG: DUF4349 domain-containing protein [Candidatus Nanohaloarchaea archaeon]
MISGIRQRLENAGSIEIGAGILLLAIAIGFVVQGPGSGQTMEYSSDLQKQSDVAPTADLGASGADAVERDSAGTDRKQVTRVYMDVETPDVRAAQSETKQLARGYNGFVDQESFNRDDGERASLTVRVPEENVSSFLSDIEERWKVESSNRNTDDVTDRYTELELELKNKRQELRQLESLMNRTEEVDSLIKIQKRMSELRTRIQYLKNSLEDLDRQVDYTRVQVSFEEPQPITSDFELRDSVRDAYQAVFRSLNLMIVGIGYLLPFLVIYGIYRGGRKLVKERQQ